MYKNICTFNLEGEIKLCKVVDIYDGDTCKVVFDVFEIFINGQLE